MTLRHYAYSMLLIVLLAIFVGCETNYTRVYNREDDNLPKCFRTYGAMPGYCKR